MGIRIDELIPAVAASLQHILPVMLEDDTNSISVQQVIDLARDIIISEIVDGGPAALDTFNELAAAMGDDPNFATTVFNSLATKATVTALNNLADVVVTKASLTGVETLTNKTLTSPAINTPTLILRQGAAPAQTAEGDIMWDTDDDWIVVGTGSGRKVFKPLAWEQIGDILNPVGQASTTWSGLLNYKWLRLWGNLSVSTPTGLGLQVRTSGDAVWQGTVNSPYRRGLLVQVGTGAPQNASTTSDHAFLNSLENILNNEVISFDGVIDKSQPGARTNFRHTARFIGATSGNTIDVWGSCDTNFSGGVDAIRLKTLSGTYTGQLMLEGVR